MTTDSILVDAKRAASLLCVSIRTFRDLIKQPTFPAARSLGPRCPRWVRAELEAFATALPTVNCDLEPPQLLAARAARAQGLPVTHAPFNGATQ